METAIGILDSGIGGLTVWSAIRRLLPLEPFVYFSDNANAPYGDKGQDFVIHRTREIVSLLLEQRIKLCVVACNTATTQAIQDLRASFDIPLVGVEPAIKPAAALTRKGKVGVLATAGTLRSPLYQQTADRYASDTEVITVVGSGLVEGIESGEWESPGLIRLLQSYLDRFRQQEVDVLVLGCTHYPFLADKIRSYFPYPIHVLDSSAAVARRTAQLLSEHELLNTQASSGAGITSLCPEPHWLRSHGLNAFALSPEGPGVAPGLFLASGPTDPLTRALRHLGFAINPCG